MTWLKQHARCILGIGFAFFLGLAIADAWFGFLPYWGGGMLREVSVPVIETSVDFILHSFAWVQATVLWSPIFSGALVTLVACVSTVLYWQFSSDQANDDSKSWMLAIVALLLAVVIGYIIWQVRVGWPVWSEL